MIFNKIQVGLDIQHDGVRCVVGVDCRGRYYVKKLHYQHFASALFSEEGQIDWPGIVFILKRMAADIGLARWPIAIALPFSTVKLQALQLPVGLHDVDIQAEIATQLRRDLPGLQEKLTTDFIVSHALPQSGLNQIIFAVTKDEVLQPYLDSVSAADLNLNIVDIDLYALKRAIGIRHGLNLVLHLRGLAYLVVYRGDEIVFYEQQQLSEALITWVMTVLSAVQHLKIDCYMAIGEVQQVKQVLSGVSSVGVFDWKMPVCHQFLPVGFEIAYGLALRAGR